MSSLLDDIRRDEELRERFVKKAWEKDSGIQNLSDFESAMMNAFNTETGRRASKWLNDEEIKALWESEENRWRMEQMLGKERADFLLKAPVEDFEIQRDLPKGQEIKPSQIRVVEVEKTKQAKGYKRKGKEVRGYKRSFAKWTPAQAKFIGVRKSKGTSTREIVKEYNEHFAVQRTKSSVATKVRRV